MDLVFDIETDDVKATKVHCIVAQNPESGEIFKFPPNKLAEGYQFLTTADRQEIIVNDGRITSSSFVSSAN